MNGYTTSAIEAALLAGQLLRNSFDCNHTIHFKEGVQNLVTEADINSERTILSFLQERYPSHGFLSEEKGRSTLLSPYLWIIDPLDGTVNFAHGIPHFSVTIALQYQNELLLGVTYQPLTQELFIAEKGKGATLNGKKLHVSSTKTLNDSFLATGFPYNLYENPKKIIERFSSILKKGLPIRRLGSAAIDLAYVAAGRFDGYYETGLKPWDVAAGMLLIQEAYGKITNWEGNPLFLEDSISVLATNVLIHEELQRYLL